MSIEIIHSKGSDTRFDYEYFRTLPRQELITDLEKKGKPDKNSWSGIRLDKWFEEQGYRTFTNIRIESPDRYMVSLTRYEFDQNPCWMVFEQNGEALDKDSFRIIFPTLRQMYWITGIYRIILEDFEPLRMPKEFILMEKALQRETLISDPKPFVKIKGYSFDSIMKQLFQLETANLIMFSSDGLKLRLEYPKHLSEAVLELAENGNYNLKSPKIPGGMWLNDIVYIQVEDKALFRLRNIDMLIGLAKSLYWELQAPIDIIIYDSGKERKAEMTELIDKSAITEQSTGFSLIPR